MYGVIVMQKIVNLLIKIYKKYGHLFQGKLFSAVILYYKQNRVSDGTGETIKYILKNFRRIKVYGGGDKASSISKLLKNVEFDSDGCHNFIYTFDIFKSVKIHKKIIGNCTLDYGKVIDHGLKDYYLESKSEFAETNNVVLDSMFEYFERLADFVENSSIENKDNIVKYIRRISNEKAESLEEALQRILLINQVQWQLGHILVGLGRLDYYLDRFECNEKEAENLFGEFFKLIHKYYVMKSNALMGDTGQICILGGINEDGAYFEGRYTKIIIQVVQKLELPDPKILLRVSKNMPDELWKEIVDTMTSNVGSPLISNDDMVIPEMIAFGYERKDACNYITSACWEPVAGESFEQNNILSLNYLEPFNYISNDTKVSEIDSYDKLLKVYEEGLERYIDEITKYLSSIKWEQDPLYSMFCDHARNLETDVSLGGAKYNNYGILTVGMANTVNAFANIKKYVFEEKKYTYAEFDKIRKDNYAGNEEIWKELKDSYKPFGKDEDEIIGFVNTITLMTQKIVENYKNPLGGKLKFGLSSPHYIMDSTDFPASFDGRKAKEPFSVHISSEEGISYTELFNFASKLDYSGRRFNGNVVDFMVSPTLVNKNRQNFQKLIKVAFQKGIYQMQANVVDSKTLIAAKNNPKQFPNLIVRVWGFNAYFNELPNEYKDYLIERAVQSELAFN